MLEMIHHDSQDNHNQKHNSGEICEKTATYFQYENASQKYAGSEYDREIKKGEPFTPSGPLSEHSKKHYHFKEEVAEATVRWNRINRQGF